MAEDSSPAPSALPYVGVEKCAACHKPEAAIWRGSAHARAFDTLVKLRRDYTITCVMCHVTGFAPGSGSGFVNPRATGHLVNVQCENCHGPGEDHLKDPSEPYGTVSEDGCTSCHSPEQDPHFEKEKRWKTIAH